MALFTKLREGLHKTREGIVRRIDKALVSFGKIDGDLFDSLEQVLIESDIGVATAMDIIERLKQIVRERNIIDPLIIRQLLKDQLLDILSPSEDIISENRSANSIPVKTGKPSVIVFSGVNGVGKTTSIAKVANKLKNEGKKVILAAADTFRAAAIDQLEIWGERAGIDIIKHSEGSDPAAVVYDAIQAAKARSMDVLICDTAGRLHTKKNLMEELKKVQKIIDRELPDSQKESLLVLDATTGQNAISQAKIFKQYIDITGIVLTKLDGTAKGGIIVAIRSELDIPVKMIGVGEKLDDLHEFNPVEFVEALFAD